MRPVLPDSNVWISWLVNDAGADRFSDILSDDSAVVVPAVIIYEVTRWLLAHNRAAVAQRAREAMEQMQLVPLDGNLASRAARVAIEHKLAMADAIILATALEHDAELWTQDSDFAGRPGVRLFEKRV
jgi:predicted nucleic acid-binding protein